MPIISNRYEIAELSFNKFIDCTDNLLEPWDSNHPSIFLQAYPELSANQDAINYLFEKQYKFIQILRSMPNSSDRFLLPIHYGKCELNKVYYEVYSKEHIGERLEDYAFDARSKFTYWCAVVKLAQSIYSLHQKRFIHNNLSPKTIYVSKFEDACFLRLTSFKEMLRLELNNPREENINNNWQNLINSVLDAKGYPANTTCYQRDWVCFAISILSSMENINLNTIDSVEKLAAQYAGCGFIQPKVRDFYDYVLFSSSQMNESMVLQLLDACPSEFDNGVPNQNAKPSIHIFAPTWSNNLARPTSLVENVYEITERADTISALTNLVQSATEIAVTLGRTDNSIVMRLTHVQDKVSKYLYLTLNDFKFSHKGVFQNGFGQGACLVSLNNRTHMSNNWHFLPENTSIRFEDSYNNYVASGARKGWAQALYNDIKKQPSVLQQSLLLAENTIKSVISVSNQLELLLRYGEIFKYRVQSVEADLNHNKLKIKIETIEEDEGSLRTLSRRLFNNENNTALDYLKSVNSEEVILGGLDQGMLSLFLPKNVYNKIKFTICSFDEENKSIVLERKLTSSEDINFREGDIGYIRSTEHDGQNKLIDRRSKSIDELNQHTHLLRVLASPGLHTQQTDAFWSDRTKLSSMPDNNAAFSEDGRETVLKILNESPLYTLQGPPGTGKSTTASYLVQEWLHCQPSSQILVTAKDHSSVDVLMAKIKDRLESTNNPIKPLMVKLKSNDIPNQTIVDFLNNVPDDAPCNLGTLKKSIVSYLNNISDYLETPSNLDEPNKVISRDIEAEISGIKNLIKKSAALIFTTTSSKDLVDLVEAQQIFDLCVIEEAGRTHGFDLALPMQAACRWILIGDQKQLQPFKYQEIYQACALEFNGMPDENKPSDILRRLSDENEINNFDKASFDYLTSRMTSNTNVSRALTLDGISTYLNTFEYLFEQRTGAQKTTLSTQRRMPKIIGDVIGDLFYGGRLQTPTEESYQQAHSNPLVSPSKLAGDDKHITFINLPLDRKFEHQVPKNSNRGIYNPKEVNCIKALIDALKTEEQNKQSIVVLSPYKAQVNEIRNQNSQLNANSFELVPLQGRKGITETELCYTADSFQGAEADIVIVSLVLNNRFINQHQLLFVLNSNRLNVMLSRAKKKLILVGCFDCLQHELRQSKDPNLDEAKHWIDKMEGYKLDYPLNSNQTFAQFFGK